jgi:hypothetical protein
MENIVIEDMLRAEELINVQPSEFTFSLASVLAHQAEVYMWLDRNDLAKAAIERIIGLGGHDFVRTPEAWQDLFLNQVANVLAPNAPGKVQQGAELIFSLRYDLGIGPSSGLARAYSAGA